MPPTYSNILQTQSHNFVFDFKSDHASESNDTPLEGHAKLHSMFEGLGPVVDEYGLAGPDTAQVDGPSGCSQDVQNTQTMYPMSDQFMPAPNACPWLGNDSSPSHYSQPSAVPQVPLQAYAGSEHGYDSGYNENSPNSDEGNCPRGPADNSAAWAASHLSATGPPSDEHNGGYKGNSTYIYEGHYPCGPVDDMEVCMAGHTNAYGPGVPFSQGQNTHLETFPPGAEYIGYASGTITDTMTIDDTLDSATTMDPSGGTSLEPPSFAPDGMACAKSRRRKTCVKAEDSSSSSFLAPTLRKRRCLDDEEEIGEGKFGAYMEANGDAVIMADPIHDPNPVNSSGRRTHDAKGNVLRTRWFGVMELDDSYSKRSVKITMDLPPNMTCVRSCDWTDQPCGLFIEINKARVAHHLLYWHGVEVKSKTPCKFEDCLKPQAMTNLGRHIEGVHYATSYQCPYCEGRWSRIDSLQRHLDKCEPLLESKTLAELEGRNFCPLDSKKLICGYIVPARNAT
ncbi:hypothetical protein EDB19DRAFT_1347164 [Suillus lakei]|nr:hypothetical protein EDB19DRAFT_1347164 [Suillus lakei]